MKKIGNVLILLLAFSALAYTAEPKINVSVSTKQAGVGSPFSITVSVENANARPVFNPPEGIRVIGQSQSQHIQFVNGRISQRVNFSYTLRAEKEGDFEINNIYIEVNGKKYKANSVSFSVKKGAGGQNAKNQSAQRTFNQMFMGGSQRNAQIGDDDIFVKTSVSKTTVYVNEPIYLEHELWTGINVSRYGVKELGKNEGFWSERISREHEVKAKKYKGRTYHTLVIWEEVLFPISTGKMKIDSSAYQFEVRLNAFISDAVTRMSQTYRVNVRALPENGKPATFSGAVGDFSFKVWTKEKSVKANNSLVLKMEVKGEGNVRPVALPDIRAYLPNDIKIYESSEKENNKTSGGRFVGRKYAEYVIVPIRAGSIKVPSIPFSYFDPDEEKYITKRSKAIALEVEPSDDASPQSMTFSQSAVTALGKDIRHIKGNKEKLNRKNAFLFKRPFPYVYMAACVLMLLATILYKMETVKLLRNEDYRRNKKAKEYARKRLKKAKSHLNDNDVNAYYGELERALLSYLTDKLNIARGAVWIDIENALKNKGVSDEDIKALKKIIDECGFARYAPGGGEQSAKEEHYNETEKTIRRFEEMI